AGIRLALYQRSDSKESYGAPALHPALSPSSAGLDTPAVRSVHGIMRWVAVAVGMLAAATAVAAPVLQRIDVLQNGTVVRLHVSTAVPSVAHTPPAEGNPPPRIYVDLPGTAFAPMTARLAAGVGQLLRVRAGQLDPTTVRVVLDLVHAVPFDVQQDET